MSDSVVRRRSAVKGVTRTRSGVPRSRRRTRVIAYRGGSRRALPEDEQGEYQADPGLHYKFTQFGTDRWQTGLAMNLRTSIITDPPDGRLPPVTEEAKKRDIDLYLPRQTTAWNKASTRNNRSPDRNHARGVIWCPSADCDHTESTRRCSAIQRSLTEPTGAVVPGRVTKRLRNVCRSQDVPSRYADVDGRHRRWPVHRLRPV